jgi:hypothetical protein
LIIRIDEFDKQAGCYRFIMDSGNLLVRYNDSNLCYDIKCRFSTVKHKKINNSSFEIDTDTIPGFQKAEQRLVELGGYKLEQ